MQAANALKQKRLRDQQKKVPFTVPDLSKVGRGRHRWHNTLINVYKQDELVVIVSEVTFKL